MGNTNRFGTLLHFVRHIGDMIAADGKKRIFYAITNIIWIAVGVAAAIGFKLLIDVTFSGEFNIVVGIICIIVCAAAAVACVLEGFLAQVILIFVSFAGIFNPEERGGNVVSFVIALLTVAGAVTACIILLTTL